VTLGLVGQLELDALVKKAAEKKAKDDAKRGIVPEDPTLRPASETSALPEDHDDEEAAIRASRVEPKAEDVFGKSTYVADDEEDDED